MTLLFFAVLGVCMSVAVSKFSDHDQWTFQKEGLIRVRFGYAHMILAVDATDIVDDHAVAVKMIRKFHDDLTRSITNPDLLVEIRHFFDAIQVQMRLQEIRIDAVLRELGIGLTSGRDKRQLGTLVGLLLYGTYNEHRLLQLTQRQNKMEGAIREVARVIHHHETRLYNLTDRINLIQQELSLTIGKIVNKFEGQDVRLIEARIEVLLMQKENQIQLFEQLVRTALSGRFPSHMVDPMTILDTRDDLLAEARDNFGLQSLHEDQDILARMQVSVGIRNSELFIFGHIPLSAHPQFELFRLQYRPLLRHRQWFMLKPDYELLAVSEDHRWVRQMTTADLALCRRSVDFWECNAVNWQEKSATKENECLISLFRHQQDEISRNCLMERRPSIEEYAVQTGSSIIVYKSRPGAVPIECPGRAVSRMLIEGFHTFENISAACRITMDRTRLTMVDNPKISKEIQIRLPKLLFNVSNELGLVDLKRIEEALTELPPLPRGETLSELERRIKELNKNSGHTFWVVIGITILGILVLIIITLVIFRYRRFCCQKSGNNASKGGKRTDRILCGTCLAQLENNDPGESGESNNARLGMNASLRG